MDVLHQIFHILISTDLLISISAIDDRIAVIFSLIPANLYLIIEQSNYDRSSVLWRSSPLALIFCIFVRILCKSYIFYIILTLDRD